MNSKSLKYSLIFMALIMAVAYSLPPPDKYDVPLASSGQQIIQQDQYIDANSVLMIVSNDGSFSYDRNPLFGRDNGFYYPYTGIDNIVNGTSTRTVCFAAGIWFAGVNSATGDTLVSVAEYASNFWPGPMVGGTYIPNADTDSLYRVYKIYSDSMDSNPNTDYLEWPASQGAPVDSLGNPLLTGNQTLWTVYNDAKSVNRGYDPSSLIGLGIEVQQTTWADTGNGIYELPHPTHLGTTQIGSSDLKVTVEIIDESLFNGHNYQVLTDNDSSFGPVWHLFDATINDTVLADQTRFGNQNVTVTDGFLIQVLGVSSPFESFEVVANGAGPVSPPASAAFNFQGFPVSDNPTDAQQVGAGLWAIHTGDTQPNGSRSSYDSFLSRVLRGQNNNGANLGRLDLEWRFTGSNSNPGVGGGYAWEAFLQGVAVWVPFEIWSIGVSTPDDTSDDVRLIPWMIDNSKSGTFNLESWGDIATAPQGFVVGDPATEHSASSGDNDPFTDWVFWFMPVNNSPGEAGYQEFEDSILSDAFNYSGPGTELMARTVLINWNGGIAPPFTQDLPEIGTVFRITTINQIEIDTFTFTATPSPTITAGAEDLSVYLKFKLINKSGNNYEGFFISMWFDPDLGNAGDDFVGCDTLNDIFFCYNDGSDSEYGTRVPAFGGKLIEGPPMNSFMKFISSFDAGTPREAYQYMNGLDGNGGVPLANGTRYMLPGDPVTGTGDLDRASNDRRMFASFGPFDFAPNDTQQIIIKLGVGQGDDPISSITKLREVLNFDPCCIGNRGDVDGDGDDNSVLDLNYMVDNMFRGGPAPPCPIEADLDFDGRSATILDLVFIIDDLYRGGPSPGSC